MSFLGTLEAALITLWFVAHVILFRRLSTAFTDLHRVSLVPLPAFCLVSPGELYTAGRQSSSSLNRAFAVAYMSLLVLLLLGFAALLVFHR